MTSTYTSASDAISAALFNALQVKNPQFTDSRAGRALEFNQTVHRIEHDEVALDLCIDIRRRVNPYYAAAEVLWLLSSNNTIDFIAQYAPQYTRFANNGSAYGHYGMRLAAHDQLKSAVQYLKETPTGRQCVLSLWHPADLSAACTRKINDIPCTLAMAVRINQKTSEVVATTMMRSNDIWLGMPYDLFYFGCVLNLCFSEHAQNLAYMHVVHNLHIYHGDYMKLQERKDSINHIRRQTAHHWRDIDLTVWPVEKIIECVTRDLIPNIHRPDYFNSNYPDLHHTMLADVFAMAAAKHIEKGPGRADFVKHAVQSPNLRQAAILFKAK